MNNPILDDILVQVIATIIVAVIFWFWKRDWIEMIYKKVKNNMYPLDNTIISLPPRSSSIVGRSADLQELKKIIGIGVDSESNINKILVIWGWPGVGKSTVALALAYDKEIQNHFRDGILWTTLGTKPVLSSELAIWGNVLGTNAVQLAPDIDTAISKLKELLVKKKILLIVDDVWSVDHAVTFRKLKVDCPIIFTTRSKEVAGQIVVDGGTIYKLSGLDLKSSRLLFSQFAKKVIKLYSDKCDNFFKKVEGLPLAIKSAAFMFREEIDAGFEKDIPRLLDEIIEEGNLLLNASVPRTNFDKEFADIENHKKGVFTVSATLRKSVNQLNDENKINFSKLGILPEKPATFDSNSLKAIWAVDDAKPIIKLFLRRGLLERVETGDYQIHALLKSLAKKMLKGEEDG